jgi:hypothetical protein
MDVRILHVDQVYLDIRHSEPDMHHEIIITLYQCLLKGYELTRNIDGGRTILFRHIDRLDYHNKATQDWSFKQTQDHQKFHFFTHAIAKPAHSVKSVRNIEQSKHIYQVCTNYESWPQKTI